MAIHDDRARIQISVHVRPEVAEALKSVIAITGEKQTECLSRLVLEERDRLAGNMLTDATRAAPVDRAATGNPGCA